MYNDWRLDFGAPIGHLGIGVACAAAALALALSAVGLRRERRPGRALALLLLRAGGVGACLLVSLQPSLWLRRVSRVPNQVAVLVDASRSMAVRPPDGGRSRAERAAELVDAAAPVFRDWRRDGHEVDLFSFGETLAPATLGSLAAPGAGADATRIGEALAEIRARYAGRELGAVILISDGIDNGRIGEGPLDGETRRTIESLGVPIHTVGIGEPALRDLSISAIAADELAFVRTPIKLEAVLAQTGLGGRQVDVTLGRNGRPVDWKTVRLEGDRSEQRVSFDWVPDRPGDFVFEVTTPVLAGEAIADNNRRVFAVKVIRDRVRVLHLCGRPSWDERFLRSILRRDPNVDLVSFFILRTQEDEQPWNPDELSLIPFPTREIFDEQLRSFDLVVFQNFNYQPYGVQSYLPGLRDYVESGGALAMIGGDLSFASGGYGSTAIADVLPVELDRAAAGGGEDRSYSTPPFRPRLTPEGRSHPVTSLSLDARESEAAWSALPPLDGLNQVRRLLPDATALLVHPALRTAAGSPAPVLAVRDAGKGRVLALLTDSAWHWGFLAAGAGGDGRAFQRFWENAIRWLVRDPGLALLRIDLDHAEYRRTQPPAARLRALRSDYGPAAAVEVALDLVPAEAAGGTPALRTFRATTNQDGEAEVDLGMLPAGAYRLVARTTLEGRPATEERTFLVRAEGHELDDVVYRSAILREIARVSGGEARERRSLAGLALRPSREIRVGEQRTIEIWSHPALLVLGMALLGAEWILRRRAGHG